MLGKLFKYDMKSLTRTMWIFTVIVLPVSVLGAVAMRLMNTDVFSSSSSRVGGAMMSQGLVAFVVMAFLAIFAYFVLAFIMVMRLFYTNFFSDQGYLTFTLPVKQSNLLLSKIFVGSIWMVISGVVAVAGCVIIVLFGTAKKGFVNTEVIYWLRQAYESLRSVVNPVPFIIEVIVQVLLMIPFGVILAYTALTLGSIVAKKHKVLAGVGFFFAISTAVSIIRNVFNSLVLMRILYGDNGFTEQQLFSRVHILTIGYCVMLAGLTVAFFFINRALITKKLNLN